MAISRYRMTGHGKRLTGCPSKRKMAKKWRRALAKCTRRHGEPRRGSQANVRGKGKWARCMRREYHKGVSERCRE